MHLVFVAVFIVFVVDLCLKTVAIVILEIIVDIVAVFATASVVNSNIFFLIITFSFVVLAVKTVLIFLFKFPS